jgi:hypothetical protein
MCRSRMNYIGISLPPRWEYHCPFYDNTILATHIASFFLLIPQDFARLLPQQYKSVKPRPVPLTATPKSQEILDKEAGNIP